MSDPSGKIGFEPGSVIAGRYKILKHIGDGGTAQVFRVCDLALQDEQVALKLLAPELVNDGESEARLRNEVLLARRLGHPNIVRVYDFGIAGPGYRFITMEYVDGVSLYDHTQRQKAGRVALADAHGILMTLASALKFAHENGVIHRDLKPENVFVSSNGVIKLGDFGAANDVESRNRITRQGTVVGTPGYMAPEQWAGKRADRRVDIYAIGILAYELATGEGPQAGASDVAAALRHSDALLPKLSEFPWWFQDFVESCSEFDLDKRLSSMGEVEDALRSWVPHLDKMERKTEHHTTGGGAQPRGMMQRLSKLFTTRST